MSGDRARVGLFLAPRRNRQADSYRIRMRRNKRVLGNPHAFLFMIRSIWQRKKQGVVAVQRAILRYLPSAAQGFPVQKSQNEKGSASRSAWRPRMICAAWSASPTTAFSSIVPIMKELDSSQASIWNFLKQLLAPISCCSSRRALCQSSSGAQQRLGGPSPHFCCFGNW